MSKEIAEEYASSLADLTVNSKPLINMLTILAEENIEHAGVIVDTVEKHLEKVHPDIKLPVLYLVDSIIKNVGGAYTQKFSQSIVNMFTRTFKQVDEKIRSQMFKLRETWHEVFPATKLYQLDVKVNLIDHAWPIQAQPQQSNIHVNPNFLKKPASTSSSLAPVAAEEDERMRSILAKKEQELLMLQRKKVEMELEQTRRQLGLVDKNVKKAIPMHPAVSTVLTPAVPVAHVNSVVTPVLPEVPAAIPVKQRLGPPVNKPVAGRIAPVSAALAGARRDPRLARRAAPPAPPPPAAAPPPALTAQPPAPAPPPAIVSNVFDIKPLDRVTKRSNVITIDVRPEPREPREPRRDRGRVRRPDRPERPDRSERPDRPERPDRLERPERPERLDRPERPERPERTDRPENVDAEPEPKFDAYLDRLHVPDPKKINKLPPIPKLPRDETHDEPAPAKRRKEAARERKKRRETKEASAASVPADKRPRKGKPKERPPADHEPDREPEVVAFKELKNYNKERYMRRNKQKSESPERADDRAEDARAPPEPEPANVPDVVVENKDVDLRVLHPMITDVPATVAQKRPSTEMLEGKVKKNKLDKFDILFGNEDVDLRQLPQVEEVTAPPPPSITDSPKVESLNTTLEENDEERTSPVGSPKKDWHEVKEKEEAKKTVPSKLDLVRAKLAEATKGKDRLGRPLLFSKSPSIERERRRTLSTEDTDLRNENGEEFDAEDHKKTISIIMTQAKEQFNDGQLDKNQYNTLMYQVLQLNEKLKLKEAKQRESLENSKRKLKAHIEENHKVLSPKSSPSERNNFGDIDERVTPAPFVDQQTNNQEYQADSDMRMNNVNADGKPKVLLPFPPMAPMFMGPFPTWRGPRRFRAPPGPPMPPFFRGKFDKRIPRPPFDPRMPIMPPVLPTPKLGMCQGESPLQRYERIETPPPLGAPGIIIPPTDFSVLEYIDQDPVKTIQIDGVPREIRFYGETAVIMLEWDDPREIKFLPGCRRVTFDNKDSIVVSFNEGYKQVEIDDQVFDIRFGAPTRELFINGRWFECFFGGQPLGVIIDGKPRLVHLEGPPPQVDIGKVKRTDLVAGKINLIVNATHMCPVYLDAKVQKFHVNGQFFTIRFVDALRTVLINEQPFRVEFGDLPKPIFVGNEKYFIRFSALPRSIKAGHVDILNMEGSSLPFALPPPASVPEQLNMPIVSEMEVDQIPERINKSPSPGDEHQGLDLLASVMPSSIAPASSSEYSLAEPLFSKNDHIPGIDTDKTEDKTPNPLAILGNINVNDLFAKLVATGIVSVPNDVKPEAKPEEKVEEVKTKPKEDKNVIHKVDLLKSETLRVKQPGLVAQLYGGMQCSGCGARFPPEHTVRYSQHLDWHFRQNRRERDSARRAHSRHWHYDLSDWVQYEEVEDLEEREKSWFETGGAEEGGAGAGAGEGGAGAGAGGAEGEAPSAAAGAPAAHACALCGDRFHQFYNEDKEEWHLRNALHHHDRYYHPLCYEDYKASLTKEEPPAEESVEVVQDVEKVEEAIEIKDADDGDASDCEVEVVEPEPVRIETTVEIDEVDDDVERGEAGGEEGEGVEEGEEDDVVLKPEPVEQVTLDDADTDDETAAERAARDHRHALHLASVKIKQEPLDPDDEPVITAEIETLTPTIETTHTSVISSIDGNMQFNVAPPPAQIPMGGIRINISKSLNTFVNNNQEDKNLEDVSADDEPLPPGEEPELEYTLKPSLEGVQLSRQPPVQRGSELSALCSIM